MAGEFWLDDQQWAAIASLLPTNQPGAHRTDDRRVISGIIHVLRSGCRWQDCPACYGPSTTVYNRFHKLEEELALARLHRFAPRSEKHIERIFNEAEGAADEDDRDYSDDIVELPDGARYRYRCEDRSAMPRPVNAHGKSSLRSIHTLRVVKSVLNLE